MLDMLKHHQQMKKNSENVIEYPVDFDVRRNNSKLGEYWVFSVTS